MHSMQIVEWGKPLEPRERPTPKPQGTEVLVRVEACGVCHSDLHLQEGYFDLGGGDKRVVHPWIGCGSCETCRRGDELLCTSMRSLGARRDGGYADHVLVPHPRYLIDYDGLSPELACVYTCSGVTAFSALKKLAHLPERDVAVIIGAGGVGLNAVMLASSVLKRKVVVADIDPKKRQAALEAGAAAAFD